MWKITFVELINSRLQDIQHQNQGDHRHQNHAPVAIRHFSTEITLANAAARRAVCLRRETSKLYAASFYPETATVEGN
jgi:hypothetical protein